MKQLILIFTLTSLITSAYSQSILLWSEDFPSELDNFYVEYPSVQVVADTIKVIGRNNTVDGQRLSIVNYDLLGDTIYTKTYGADLVLNNKIIDYQFDSSNHIYILQQEKLAFFKSKIVLQKYSLDGNLIWVEQIESYADTSYSPHSLGLANDTCVFIAARKEYNYPEPTDHVVETVTLPYLYAYNANGSQLWEREFDPNSEFYFFGHKVFVYNNTAFILSLNTALDRRLIKVDIDNNLSMNTNTGILSGASDFQITSDNKILITRIIPFKISKHELNGTIIWEHEYPIYTTGHSTNDGIRSIVQDSLGNIYVTGRHYGMYFGTPEYSNADILTLKYDVAGNLIWENRYEYGGSNVDIGDVILLKNGSIYVGGTSQRSDENSDLDYIVLKMDAISGLTNGVYKYNGIENGNDGVNSMSILDNGSIILTGLSYMNSKYNWTTQLLSDIAVSIDDAELENNFQIYPNPIKNGETLNLSGLGINSYSIISSLGQIIQDDLLKKEAFHIIHLNNLETGVYFIRLNTDKKVITKKIVVE